MQQQSTQTYSVPTVPAEQNAAWQDIAHLLKNWQYDLSNYEEYLQEELSDEGAAWLYQRHQGAISQWLCESMTDLYTFYPDVLWPLDNPVTAKWEVVYKWACVLVHEHLEALPQP